MVSHIIFVSVVGSSSLLLAAETVEKTKRAHDGSQSHAKRVISEEQALKEELHQAIERGNGGEVTAAIQKLRARSLSVDEYVRGRSGLQKASELGYVAIMQILLDAGADINYTGYRASRETSLILAAKGGHQGAMSELLNRGATVTGAFDDKGMQSNFRPTALHWCAKNGLTNMIPVLVEKGCPIDWLANGEAGEQILQTALHWAAKHNQADVIQALIIAGASTDCTVGNQETPLHMAAQFGSLDAIIKLLDLDANIEAEDFRGHTPVMHAALKGQEAAGNLLIARGAKVANERSSVIHQAAAGGHMELVQRCIDGGMS